MKILSTIADLLHFSALLILLYRILKSKSCNSLSCKTQELYLIVFCLRYLDLFMYFISIYNTCMKLFFIFSTALTIYLMRYKNPISQTYDSQNDEFPHFKIILPLALFLTILVNSGWEIWEFIWSFSYWLESIGFIPQIMMQRKINTRAIVTEDITT